MPETAVPSVEFSADADLISFLKAIPDGRYRRGVRYPQWYLGLPEKVRARSSCQRAKLEWARDWPFMRG
jgi:hypothetical protein